MSLYHSVLYKRASNLKSLSCLKGKGHHSTWSRLGTAAPGGSLDLIQALAWGGAGTMPAAGV